MSMVPAKKVKEVLDKIEHNEEWCNTVKSLLVRLSQQCEQLYAAVAQLANEVRGTPSPANGETEAVDTQNPTPPRGGVRVGADGNPVAGAQLAAEEAMDQAAGPAQGTPAPQRQRTPKNRPPQTGGQVRHGADGKPITDPAQLAAEEAMDQAMGE